jgi:hypothetical protein
MREKGLAEEKADRVAVDAECDVSEGSSCHLRCPDEGGRPKARGSFEADEAAPFPAS